MRQVLCRRFRHYLDGDSGFAERPDALLIDGGAVHAETVRAALSEMGVFLPIFGMVKDNRHRTRALVTPDGQEISIQSTPAVFALIGRIQEETHRFAITYQRTLRSRHVRGSQLDAIPGIGGEAPQSAPAPLPLACGHPRAQPGGAAGGAARAAGAGGL